jgi:hypothetical protein
MTRYVNRWTAQAAWVVLMGIFGMVFVPSAVTVVSFAMFAVAGSAVLVAASVLWGAHQPVVSASQARVAADAAEAVGRRG